MASIGGHGTVCAGTPVDYVRTSTFVWLLCRVAFRLIVVSPFLFVSSSGGNDSDNDDETMVMIMMLPMVNVAIPSELEINRKGKHRGDGRKRNA